VWDIRDRTLLSFDTASFDTAYKAVSDIRIGLKYAGPMTPMAPILLVVGGAKAEL